MNKLGWLIYLSH